MYITTFYSFKGGVGRTMALVNAAVHLAMRGRNVLVVDFDIEAPGLDTFDVLKPHSNVEGVVDFVNQYLKDNEVPDVSNFVGECPQIGENNGKLWIMPSGKKDTYITNFNQVDWGELYDRRDGYLLFEDLKAQWKEVLNPDYVLIDSRTGHTDTSGICTRQLPDAVVMLFFPNEQNLRGLVDVVSAIRTEAKSSRKKEIKLHFVMSNVPDLDDEDEILENKINEFKSALNFRQEPLTVHRYDSLSLLNQVVFTKDRPKSRLANEYRKIVDKITFNNWRDRGGALQYIESVNRQWEWMGHDSMPALEETLGKIEREHKNDGEVLFRLAKLAESRLEFESISSLIIQAIKAGCNYPEAYLIRSRFREENEDLVGANSDVKQVLSSIEVPVRIITEAISRLIRIGICEIESVIDSPAIFSLDHDGKLWLASKSNRSRQHLVLAASLLEELKETSELSEHERNDICNQLGLVNMGLGEYSEARKMFEYGQIDLLDMGIDRTFNRAMADWGEKKKLNLELFQRVVEIDCSNSNPEYIDSPNYYQCLAIAHWAVGDLYAALENVKRAKQFVSDGLVATQFSCWRYLEVDDDQFESDLNEIQSMIENSEPKTPKFMSTACGNSAPNPNPVIE